ncbi:MAG: zinc-ribbon domain-containing protein, partial [Deltaproteobacteria bacterium]|nr:zinc-ribbon domain-containing protein [Deltaproteobacteria bacterium]
MINCPKCGTPNPDKQNACLACGAGLAAEVFAEAMDRATASDPQLAVPPAPQAEAPQAAAPQAAAPQAAAPQAAAPQAAAPQAAAPQAAAPQAA